MRSLRFVGLVTSLSIVTGCAVTQQQFDRQRATLRNDEVCRAYLAATKSTNLDFQRGTDSELRWRQINPSDCPRIASESSRQAVGVLAAILVGAAVVAVARNGGGGGGYAQPANDYDWAWDQFFNENYQLVWACRGRQTGQFAALERCTYKPKNDFAWPSKRADGR